MANDGVIRKCPKLRITVKLTGLKDKDDSNGDRLTDTEEYEMSNDPDPYSVDGRALPTRKDIFVEVDWMPGHEMGDEAKWKVGTRFLNNPTGEEIWLHLDDGPMGGGEQVQHCDGDTITFDRRNGEHDDFANYSDDYFNSYRDNKFYHWLMWGIVTNDVDSCGGVPNGNFW